VVGGLGCSQMATFQQARDHVRLTAWRKMKDHAHGPCGAHLRPSQLQKDRTSGSG